jgi:PKD repeat protein
MSVKVNPNLPPVVDLGQDIETSVNERFFLDSRGVTDPNGDALEYSWDFDASDGIQEESTEKLPTWRYQKAGTYVVTLTVTDGQYTANGTLNVSVVESLIPVSGKKYDHTGTLGPGKKMTYWATISKGKGLKVTVKSTNGKLLDTFLFESANFYKYMDSGELVAITEGSKQGATSFSYSVEIPKTDDYHIMIRNPGSEDLSYKISIEVVSLGVGNRTPDLGPAGLLTVLITVVVLGMRGRKKEWA